MSGTHGDCAEGCTDCPTCRGEVQPDSPAMHDMNFALAMAPKGGDPFWNAMGVAQMVRDGVKARGGSGAGDQQILDFVEDVAHAKVMESAGSPWGSPWMSWAPEAKKFDPMAPPVPPPGAGGHLKGAAFKTFGGRHRTDKDYGAGWNPGWRPVTPEDMSRVVRGKETRTRSTPWDEGAGKPYDPRLGYVKRKCCVDKFLYPEYIQSDTQGANLAFKFWVTANYKESLECACSCCVVEQYVRKRVVRWDGQVDREAGTPGEEFRQDCIINNDDNHNTAKEDPKPTDVLDCYGSAGDTIDSHKSNAPFTPAADGSGICRTLRYDRPTHPRGFGNLVTWEFVGVILDRCYDLGVKEMRWFEWTEGGSISPLSEDKPHGTREAQDGTPSALEEWTGGDPLPGWLAQDP